ncbi:MAG: ATP phosphoribosyltransferase regulatory subunit [Candidatus Verstraetearchaeota archaeon]|nr:ATP phosphoribosyltransferase regulatory subunit [Candidatus Verstraetearchaeota archaeon]
MGPEEVKKYLFVEERFREVLKRWGYREVRTSTMDYFDIIRGGAGEGFTDSIFKVQDSDGRLLSLRGEVTTQIARMLASKAKDEGRLCYIANCIRYIEAKNLSLREYWQAGAELIGGERVASDAEAVALALEMLDSAGIPASVDLGSMSAIRELMDHFRIKDYRRVVKAISMKSVDELKKLTCDRHAIRAFSLLMSKRGKAEVVKMVSEEAGCLEGEWRYFRDLYCALDAYGYASRANVDLSTMRELEYYNGVVFELFLGGIGLPIGGGGRYDIMMEQFGLDSPATGFALSVDLCVRALSKSDNNGVGDDRVLRVFYEEGYMEKAVGLVRRLRSTGRACTLDKYKGEQAGLRVGERVVWIETGDEYEL